MPQRSRLPLPGRTVLVTGAASGIGAATTRALAASGANVVLVDLPSDPLDALAAELGDRALAAPADVTDTEALTAVVHAGVARFGAIDVVFANAGIAAKDPTTLRVGDPAEVERILEVNVLGVWRTVHACLPQIVAARGHVLVTASIYAYVNGMANAPYAMAKAAVEQLGRALRAELAGTGATAGVLYPGWVSTPIIRASTTENPVSAELLETAFPGPYRATIPPEDVAAAALAGIEGRERRVFAPRRWAAPAMLRGPVNALTDAVVDRHRKVHRLMRELERRSGGAER